MNNKFFSLPYEPKTDEEKLVALCAELGKYKLYKKHMAQDQRIIAERSEMFFGMDTNYDYDAKNKTALNALLKYSCEGSGVEYNQASLKSSNTMTNPMFRNRFFGVISRALPLVITSTVNYGFMPLSDVRNVGWGDNLHFKVSSPDIFTVQRVGKNKRQGALQRVYRDDIVLTPKAYEVRTDVPWYQVAAGLFDLGDYMVRVALGYSTHLTTMVYEKINDTYATLPSPLAIGGAFDELKFMEMAQRVQMANQGMTVSVIGTKMALAKVMPSNDYLKVQLGEEFASIGYLGRFKGVNLIEVPNPLVPGTGNTTLDFAVSNNRLYFFSMDADKPIKIGFEGDVIATQEDGFAKADGGITNILKYFYDAEIATSASYAIYDITA